jgi:hypothetical protein
MIQTIVFFQKGILFPLQSAITIYTKKKKFEISTKSILINDVLTDN